MSPFAALAVVAVVVLVLAAVYVRDQFRHPEYWAAPPDDTECRVIVVIVPGAPPSVPRERRYGVVGGNPPQRPSGRPDRILDGGVLVGEVVEQVPAAPGGRLDEQDAFGAAFLTWAFPGDAAGWWREFGGVGWFPVVVEGHG